MNEQKVLEALIAAGKPMKTAEIATITGIDKTEVGKILKNLIKEGKANSPKNCFYGAL